MFGFFEGRYMSRILCILIFCSGIINASSAPLISRQNYVQRMYNAFLIQSIGETRIAYLVFNNAFQDAKNAGESPKKLEVMNQLFIWYRKFGWYCDLMLYPSGCTDEYGNSLFQTHRESENDYFRNCIHPKNRPLSQYAKEIDYQNEWKKDPRREKHVRNYFIGTAELMVGLFCLANLSTPVGLIGFAATAVGSDGISRIINSLNDAYSDRKDCMRELEKIDKKAKQAAGQ